MRNISSKETEYMLETLCAGDAFKGSALLMGITDVLGKAREKHPRYAGSADESLEVIRSEFREFEEACKNESLLRQYEEAFDLIAVCIRFLNGEWLHMKGESENAE